jgi:hypothetical protein
MGSGTQTSEPSFLVQIIHSALLTSPKLFCLSVRTYSRSHFGVFPTHVNYSNYIEQICLAATYQLYTGISGVVGHLTIRFYSTDGTGGITTCLHKKFPHFFAWVLMHSVLLIMFVAQISTAFSIPGPRMWVLHHNFYCVISCYLPLK